MSKKASTCIIRLNSQKLCASVKSFIERYQKRIGKLRKHANRKRTSALFKRSIATRSQAANSNNIKYVPVVVDATRVISEHVKGTRVGRSIPPPKVSDIGILEDVTSEVGDRAPSIAPSIAQSGMPSSVESSHTVANLPRVVGRGGPIGSITMKPDPESNPQLKALNNIEVNKLAVDMIGPRKFLGVVPRDHIKDVTPLKTAKSGFVFNTDTSDGKGKHWRSVVIDPRRGKRSIEYYDSFGEAPESDITDALNRVTRKISTQPFQYKINMIKNQHSDSETCGWHSLKYLQDSIIKNKPFKELTGFDMQEDNVKQLAKSFDYI